MDKRLRLIVLISSSYLLTEQDKSNLMKRLKDMPPDIINTLGVLLATEKKQALESIPQLNKNIENLFLILK